MSTLNGASYGAEPIVNVIQAKIKKTFTEEALSKMKTYLIDIGYVCLVAALDAAVEYLKGIEQTDFTATEIIVFGLIGLFISKISKSIRDKRVGKW